MSGIFLLLFLCSAKDGCHWTKIGEAQDVETCTIAWQGIAAKFLGDNPQYEMKVDPKSGELARCIKLSGERGA